MLSKKTNYRTSYQRFQTIFMSEERAQEYYDRIEREERNAPMQVAKDASPMRIKRVVFAGQKNIAIDQWMRKHLVSAKHTCIKDAIPVVLCYLTEDLQTTNDGVHATSQDLESRYVRQQFQNFQFAQ